ncbi:MAG: hypothetical protein C4617_02210 [Candidatus Liberibacter europaeus]|uniref:Outer membrane protein assembly factor BamE domain-containing protein n=1 Tax=Candidatus Liberibacter europaeus TaxID=744859 RepID=A0A2T4VY00_9HYPH|nr:hypothetical protein [Candidatus Liberibacter europaeus]PTL86652.1 MAG: hypothetical protein C4617_02210 [Candidatus Liberibacter europaeus]
MEKTVKKMLVLQHNFSDSYRCFFYMLKVAFLIITITVLMSGCHAISISSIASGIVLEKKSLLLISKKSSREHVIKSLGNPSFTSLFDKDGSQSFYYVSQKKSRFLPFHFFNEKVVDRTVLKISFGRDGIVSRIKKYTLDDARKIQINSETTTIPISKEVGLFQKLTKSRERNLLSGTEGTE